MPHLLNYYYMILKRNQHLANSRKRIHFKARSLYHIILKRIMIMYHFHLYYYFQRLCLLYYYLHYTMNLHLKLQIKILNLLLNSNLQSLFNRKIINFQFHLIILKFNLFLFMYFNQYFL